MKRIGFLLALMVWVVVPSFADLRVFNVLAQGFLQDKSPFRYSPLNTIQNDSSLIYAVHRADLDLKKPVLTFLFADQVTLSGIELSGGYFDTNWFEKNDRISAVRIATRDKTKGAKAEFKSSLTSKMLPQRINFGKEITCTELDLFVEAILPGSSWDDICISHVEFLVGGEPVAVQLTTNGKLAFLSGYRQYRYDSEGNVVERYSSYGKAGDERELSHYNPDGVVDFTLNRAMDDYTNDRYSNFYYDEKDPKRLRKMVVFDRTGLKVEEHMFIYDSQNRNIQENIDGISTKQISNSYVGDVLTSTTTTSSKSTQVERKTTFLFAGGKIVGETEERRQYSAMFQYFNENGKLKLKVPAGKNDWDITEYIYDDVGRLTSENWYSHQSSWGYFGD